MTLSMEEIANARRVFGPAPILTSEEPERFEDFFVQLAIALKPRDFMEVLLIWHFTLASWNVNRYTLHAAVAIERHHEEGVRPEMERARLIHAQGKQEIRAEIRSCRPSDIAALEELNEISESSITDLEEIHERKKRELDHNNAFERSMAFQEQLDRLSGNASRRRDDTLTQLELYRAGLGAQARETAAQILEGEFKEVMPIEDADAG
jgi:hypothetical protein